MNRRPAMRALLSLALSAALTFAPSAFALGPLEKNLPTVEAGTQAYDEGRFEDALAAYEAAKKEKPDSAVIDFNIGNALYKLGRYDEAREAWLRAANADRRDLKAKDYYNLGNGFAALNQDKDAISSYRKALTLDPNDEMARHNLEVLLRKLPPKQNQQSPDGGTDGGEDGGTDGGHPDGGMKPDGGNGGGNDGGSDGGTGMDGGSPDGGSPDGGSPDGGSPDGGGQDGGAGDGGSDGGTDGGSSQQKGDAGTPDAGQQDGGQGEGEGGADGGMDAGMSEGERGGMDAGTAQDLSEQDAQKLLDSMKRNEKNLQLWRFQQRKKPRNPDAKDW